MLMLMKPNFMRVSVLCISCAACLLSFAEGPLKPPPSPAPPVAVVNTLVLPSINASPFLSCLLLILSSSFCCSSSSTTSFLSRTRSSSSFACLDRSSKTMLLSSLVRFSFLSAMFASIWLNSESSLIFWSLSSTFASSSKTPSLSVWILLSWCISFSNVFTPSSNSLISSSRLSMCSSHLTFSCVKTETSLCSLVACSLCSSSIWRPNAIPWL
mmetsp:Transcript_9950/g.18062  ORF Transcript_9950/g.18062 Transcript_9950/m.18062 type:complete len:213 (-) Transcript_9950:5688-6326(-)